MPKSMYMGNNSKMSKGAKKGMKSMGGGTATAGPMSAGGGYPTSKMGGSYKMKK